MSHKADIYIQCHTSAAGNIKYQLDTTWVTFEWLIITKWHFNASFIWHDYSYSFIAMIGWYNDRTFLKSQHTVWMYKSNIGLNEYAIIYYHYLLTHWSRVTHICVGTNTNIGSDNGLSPGRRQAIIWTNAGILLIGPLGTNFSGILSEIHTFSFKKMHFKTSSAK